MKLPRIGVVIPYYQTTDGLLDGALRTILAQQGLGTEFWVDVVVVDDSSPSPARDDGAVPMFAPPNTIAIIRQENTGAAGARNAGIDAVPAETPYIAFLDSDDTWAPGHLLNALTAFRQGFDFYFADHKRDGWTTSKFAMRGFSPADSDRVDRDREVYAYRGDIWSDILERLILQTSTVAYDRRRFADLRFPTNLSNHEDDGFWIQFADRGARMAFCRQIESFMGEGVNISVTEGYGSDKGLRLSLSYLRFWRAVPTLIRVDQRNREIMARRRARARADMMSAVLNRLQHRKASALDAAILTQAVCADPGFVPTALRIMLETSLNAFRRVLGLRK